MLFTSWQHLALSLHSSSSSYIPIVSSFSFVKGVTLNTSLLPFFSGINVCITFKRFVTMHMKCPPIDAIFILAMDSQKLRIPQLVMWQRILAHC